jgi:PTH1 family peptidyl-tRNA hydrolase
MRVIVGLGNPGKAYEGTRHNVGFAVVDELARRWRLLIGRVRDGVRCARGSIDAKPVMLVKPYMYMNLSGEALARGTWPLTANDLIVVHDDLDLECGCVRVKCDGGTAGHHGLDSIVGCFDRDFARVRVGVGRAPRGTETANYLLSRFEVEEREKIATAVERAAAAVECIVREGEEAAMNRFNVRRRTGPAVAAAPMGRS